MRGRFALFGLAVTLSACGGGGPPCAVLTLDGDTSGGGGIELDDPMDSGERTLRAIAVSVSEVPNIPSEGFRAGYVVDCDNPGCEVEIECSPDLIDAGQSMSCDVFDATEDGAEACDWSCRIAFEVGLGDTSVCETSRIIFELVGRHEPST